ncbi:uncharacterized protein LOC111593103 [Drosophila hydei]|uniref:Uncharacterized protein LOC111593103 n=1 Tax=Drosophila hydei TaxID=7224 RepID=A0A6J1LE11_DROHY|nr:uncharacterized protein LOC111593103 [Drosophila hydei]
MHIVSVVSLIIGSIFAYTLAAPQTNSDILSTALANLAIQLAKQKNSTIAIDNGTVIITGIANSNATATIDGHKPVWQHYSRPVGWNYGWINGWNNGWNGFWRGNPEEENDIETPEDDGQILELMSENYHEDPEDADDAEELVEEEENNRPNN